MLVQFTAEWCGYCHKMKATTYANPAVQRAVNQNFIPVMLDADTHSTMVEKLKLTGLPSTVLVGSDLRVWKKLNGFKDAQTLQAAISETLSSRQVVKSVAYARTRKPVVREKPTRETPDRRARVTARKPSGLPAVRPQGNRPTEAPPKVIRRTPERYAFGGLCLVSLRDAKELQRGKSQFSTDYAGVKVSFATQDALLQFRRNPEKYWPSNNGQCAVSARDGKPVTGRLEFGVMFRDEVWLFASADHMQRFVQSPDSFTR